MGATYHVGSGLLSQNDNTTRYYPILPQMPAGVTTEDGVVELLVRSAGSFSNASLVILTNTCSVSSVWTLRKSRAATAIAITITSDATGTFTDTDSVSFAATDEVDYQMVIPTEAGTNTMTWDVAGIVWTADSATTGWLMAHGYSDAGDSATRFFTLQGDGDTLAEANTQHYLGASYTLTNFWVDVKTNGRSTTSTIQVRKNGAGVGGTLSYAAAETGLKEDTTTAALSSGDKLCGGCTTSTGGGSFVFNACGVELSSANGDWQIGHGNATGLSQLGGVTNNYGLSGAFDIGVAEGDIDIVPLLTFTVDQLYVYISANTIPVLATTATLRVDAANSALTVSFAAGETGVKSDVTHSVTVTNNTNAVNWQIIAGGATGAVTLRSLSARGNIAAAATGNPWYAYVQQ